MIVFVSRNGKRRLEMFEGKKHHILIHSRNRKWTKIFDDMGEEILSKPYGLSHDYLIERNFNRRGVQDNGVIIVEVWVK